MTTNLFIIANIIGIIVFALGFWLLVRDGDRGAKRADRHHDRGTVEHHLRLRRADGGASTTS